MEAKHTSMGYEHAMQCLFYRYINLKIRVAERESWRSSTCMFTPKWPLWLGLELELG